MIRKMLFILFGVISFQTNAQHDSAMVNTHTDVYQIRLTDSVKCIQLLEYEKTGESIKGYLDDNKTIIYLEDYKVNNKVRLKIIYQNGREEEIMRSPCSIELKYTI